MRPFPAQYIDNYPFYESFVLGRHHRAPEGPKKEKSLLNKKVVFLHINLALGPQNCNLNLILVEKPHFLAFFGIFARRDLAL